MEERDRLDRANKLLREASLRKESVILEPGYQEVAEIEQRLKPDALSNNTIRGQASPPSFTFKRSVQRLLPISVLRLLRPKVRRGCQRLEWRCSCGRAMYGDYSRRDAMQSSSLVRNLPGCKIVHTAGDNDASRDHDKAPMEQLSSSNVPSNTGNGLSNASTLVSTGGVVPTDSELESISLNSTSMQQLSKTMPAFFELCVNGSKTRICLGEIIINDGLGNCCIKTDMQLFSESFLRL